ncbi:acetate/propionate family kinase [Acaryochloris sp. CCMEE 5410]|uniref:acetate/propionate family kinase n=1 Tax=Acaryochloris sp. CCMEE 5410 TaxID=310037 RepID=UPI000494BD8F|nr:acetate kinase [Acaryochloris sp. CCMEE 5410]KAI9130079.1 acetate kinase [Acaryochloris sp. CCMEE 5410]
MKILVLNAGSSSHKCCLYTIDGILPEPPPTPLWEAELDWHDQNNAALIVKTKQDNKLTEELSSLSRSEALLYLLGTLWQGATPVLQGLKEIDVVSHRVVHGGHDYQSSVVVTAEVKDAISTLIPLAPAHNPANLEGIVLMEQLLGNIPQVAVFDTAFHSHIPDVSTTYPGPYDWIEQGIRRYGFHGISHQYCAQRAAQLLNLELADLRLIICHLGNGASLAAVKKGQCIDTTMGFTPLDGLMMGTRSGSVDPGILIHLMHQGYSADRLDHLLNQESGLKGISGISHDLRDVEIAISQGHKQAKLARDLYLHRLKSCLGAMLMSLGGADVIVFTAGIGEHSAGVRAEICDALAFLGVKIDPTKNDCAPVDQDIAAAESTIRVLVIHTQEDWMIAKESWNCLMT